MKQVHNPEACPCDAPPQQGRTSIAVHSEYSSAQVAHAGFLHADASLRSTSILLLGYAILGTGNGLLCLLISLHLIQQQASPIAAGAVQSTYYFGFALGAIFGGLLIGRIGHHRAFVTFAAIPACCIPAYAVWDAVALWAVLRLITGFCVIGTCTVVESWIHEVVGNAQRCRIFSVYMMINYLALGAGQFLAGLAGPERIELFSATSVLFTASLIPVTLARTAQAPSIGQSVDKAPYDSRASHGLLGISTIYRRAPLGLVACLAAGMLNGAFCAMQPTFMQRLNHSVVDISLFMGCALVAALVAQWPIGHFADRFDRRKILFFLATLTASLSVLLAAVQHGVLVVACGYLYAAAAFSMYGVISSHVNDDIPPDQRIAVSAGLLLTFSLGAGCGPILASASMTMFGPGGLYWFSASIGSTLAVLILWNHHVHRVTRRR